MQPYKYLRREILCCRLQKHVGPKEIRVYVTLLRKKSQNTETEDEAIANKINESDGEIM